MKTIGNILWFIFTGLGSAISWCILGIFWCITIIGIPFGKQCFKIAHLTVWPFGREAKTDFSKHVVGNIIWIIFGGLELAIGYVLAGILWCITIIGIPFGKQCFKLAGLAFMPFGATIQKIEKGAA